MSSRNRGSHKVSQQSLRRIRSVFLVSHSCHSGCRVTWTQRRHPYAWPDDPTTSWAHMWRSYETVQLQFSCNAMILLPGTKTQRHVNQMRFNPTEGGGIFLDWEQHPVVFSGHIKIRSGVWFISQPPTSCCESFLIVIDGVSIGHPCPDNTWLTSRTTRIPTTDHSNFKQVCSGWGHRDDFISSP